MHGDVHSSVRQLAPDHLVEDVSGTRSFAFSAPGEPQSLVFFFHKLANPETHRAVKNAVEALQARLGGLPNTNIEVISAMPHVHLRGHEGTSGASPGSLPRPVYPDQVPAGWEYRFYQPINPRLDLAYAVTDAEPVPVAVLDSMPDLERARRRAEEFDNKQLAKTLDSLRGVDEILTDAQYRRELDELALHHEPHGGSDSRSYPVPDHGLFISGLIHGIAPRAPLSLEPVLDDRGLGDLSLLLRGLQRVLERKQPDEPQIINLSLGFLPHPARLPAAWFGLRRPHDPLYLYADEMYDDRRDERWIAANRSEVGRMVDLLELGLRELGRYLGLNNCLVIAAAGNDSLAQVERRQARMEPRLPARFDTVLGVAATTSDPRQPASYSNVGDERELGDHVATFGGNASDALEPEDGVLGIYSGQFPDQRPNETGWAFWSGTSFATGIVSGIAANYWAAKRKSAPELRASDILADLHAEASAFGPYVPSLRTPAIEVRGRWGRY
jgi:subtilisin family serine protease